VEFLGDSALLHLEGAGGEALVLRGPPSLSAAMGPEAGPEVGEAVHLAFDPARALLFGEDGRRRAILAREGALVG